MWQQHPYFAEQLVRDRQQQVMHDACRTRLMRDARRLVRQRQRSG